MNLSRRTFIASAALAPVACSMGGLSYERGVSVAQPNPVPAIRPPQVGQEWTYIKRNAFDGKTVALITERVASIGSTIVIERSDEGGMRLPSEVQGPWGTIITDPNWSRTISFNPAIPLWPLELSSSWSKQFNTQYTHAGYPGNSLRWQEYMSVNGWDQITVPAGVFLALCFQNLINYQSDDDNKLACVHKQTYWFAPSIGRWVAAESSGSYQIQGQLGGVIPEGSYQWQLTSYK